MRTIICACVLLSETKWVFPWCGYSCWTSMSTFTNEG